jgi:hypothetical protein
MKRWTFVALNAMHPPNIGSAQVNPNHANEQRNNKHQRSKPHPQTVFPLKQLIICPSPPENATPETGVGNFLTFWAKFVLRNSFNWMHQGFPYSVSPSGPQFTLPIICCRVRTPARGYLIDKHGLCYKLTQKNESYQPLSTMSRCRSYSPSFQDEGLVGRDRFPIITGCQHLGMEVHTSARFGKIQ